MTVEQYFCPTDDALGNLDAVALREAFATQQLRPQEAVRAAIARAEGAGILNALVVDRFDDALAEATALPTADQRSPGALLSGIPSVIKDTDAVVGLPCRYGSRAMPTEPSVVSSPFVEQFRATGVVPIGISNMPEFGLTGTTESVLYGPTRNPWDLDYSAGGSSGGSAALVAAGVVPIAHGNDGGGSLRIPAAACGLVALKPTRDRLRQRPTPKMLPVDLVVQGFLTRTVRDTALALAASEKVYCNPSLAPVGHVVAPIERALRIGWFTQSVRGTASDSVTAAETERIAALCASLGHRVEAIDNPFDGRLHDAFELLWSFLPTLLAHFGQIEFGAGFDADRLESFTRHLASRFQKQVLHAPAAFGRLRGFAADYQAQFERFDVLLTPTTAGPVPPLGYLDPELPGEVHMARIAALYPFTPPHNVAGAPAISLPLANDLAGRPLGMQFAGPAGGEAELLALALQLEQAAPWDYPMAGPSAEAVGPSM